MSTGSKYDFLIAPNCTGNSDFTEETNDFARKVNLSSGLTSVTVAALLCLASYPNNCYPNSNAVRGMYGSSNVIRTELLLAKKRENEVYSDIISLDDVKTDDFLNANLKNIQIANRNATLINKNRDFLFSKLKNRNIVDTRIKKYFDTITEQLCNYKLASLFVSHMNDSSLFFRFSDSANREFKLQVFYDYDESDSDDVEATLHIYTSNFKPEAHYGSITYLFSVVNKEIAAISKSRYGLSYF